MRTILNKTLSLLVVLLLVTASFGSLPASAAGNDGQKLTITPGSVTGGGPSARPENLSPAEKKLDTQLLQLARPDLLPQGTTASKQLEQLEKKGQLTVEKSKDGSSAYLVNVYVQMKPGADFSALGPVVSAVTDKSSKYNLAAAQVDVKKLKSLAALECVKSVQIVTPPVICSGSATSEGDSVLRADMARAASGSDGTGIKVGVISDGASHYTTSVATGDLPADVTILSDAVGGDEGTAMMEIVHDLAPGADLYFHDCGDNELQFIQAIDDLIAAGCTVVCDDIYWITQPCFEDGVIASHVKDLVTANNILYVSSAGNYADSHYQGMYRDDGTGHNDFNTGDPDTGHDLYVHMTAGSSIYVVLQWNDPFGAAGDDYDLYLGATNRSGYYAYSAATQDGSGDPLEGIYYTATSDMDAAIWVTPYHSPTAKTLEVYIFGDGDSYNYSNNITPADSIYGHTAVPGVLSCAAIRWSTPTTAEYFSSQGPVTTLTGTRAKPDIAGVDGVAVTGSGGFPNPFYGTSASAPHVAAIAALLWSEFPGARPNQIRQALTETSVDLGSTGYDNTFGFGRIDALNAVQDTCTVSFDSQGGGAVPASTVLKGTAVSEPAAPVWSDHAFAGWYLEPGCVTAWDFSAAVTSDMTLYAKWTSTSTNCTVTFDSQGGSAVSPATMPNGSLLTEPTPPTRDHYSFGGWFREAACTTAWNFASDHVTADITLYAKWTAETHTVTFDSQGGSAVPPASVPYDSLLAEPTPPTLDHYAFGGWFREAACTTAWNFASDHVTADITLYAKWTTETHTVTFDSQGGSAVSPSSVPYDSLLAEPAPPTRDHYSFGGWFREAACTTAWNFASDHVTADITLYAKWTAETCTVTFDSQGGSAVSPATVAYNGTVTEPASPTKSGYIFYGWYKEPACTNKWNFQTDTVTADITLYARWVSSILPVPQSVKAASASYTSVKVTWGTTAYATGYQVYRATSSYGPWTLLSTVTGTSATATGLTTNTTYYFRVRSYADVNGTRYVSLCSSVVSAKPVPAAPATISAAQASYSSIRVSWAAVAGATKYELYRSTSRTGTYKLLTTTTALNYTNTGLATGTSYFYKVRAYHLEGSVKVYGAYSPIATAKPTLAVPTPVRAARASATSIKVWWGGAAGASGYEVWRSASSGGTYSLVKAQTSATFVNTGLVKGRTYYYKVRAYRVVSGKKVYSAYSAVVKAST